MGIWRWVDKTLYRFLVTSGCLLSRKVWWAVRIGSFWPEIEVFYRPEWTKGRPLKNEFCVFSNSEMNVTEKVDQKIDSSSFHVSFLSYGL